MKDINAEYLAKEVPLFSQLSPEQRERFLMAGKKTAFKRGAVIFQEGEAADKLYIVLSGRVKISRFSLDGREAILHIFGPGEPIGEAAALQNGNFPARAEALEDTDILYWPRQSLLELIVQDPSFALNLMAALALRLKSFADRIETLALHETPQRLAAYLLHQSEVNDNAECFELDINKGLLAAMLGTARETLSRCLGRFAKDAVIELEGRKVRILNRPRLEALAEGRVMPDAH